MEEGRNVGAWSIGIGGSPNRLTKGSVSQTKGATISWVSWVYLFSRCHSCFDKAVGTSASSSRNLSLVANQKNAKQTTCQQFILSTIFLSLLFSLRENVPVL